MEKPISVGDLVVINTRAKHGCDGGIGLFFRVTKIRQSRRGKSGMRWTCNWCGASGERSFSPTQLVAEGFAGSQGIPLTRLKRIPPLEELDDIKHDEEITA